MESQNMESETPSTGPKKPAGVTIASILFIVGAVVFLLEAFIIYAMTLYATDHPEMFNKIKQISILSYIITSGLSSIVIELRLAFSLAFLINAILILRRKKISVRITQIILLVYIAGIMYGLSFDSSSSNLVLVASQTVLSVIGYKYFERRYVKTYFGISSKPDITLL
jgi:hypothetical protein